MQPGPYGSPHPPPKKKDNTIIIIIAVVVAVLVVGVLGLGVLSSLAIFGTKRYLEEAKASEGKNKVSAIARGILACTERETIDPVTNAAVPGKLPPTSAAIPSSLSMVKGTKYQSASTEWSADPAFSCARFEIFEPQYFQYQWVLDSGGMSGTVRAMGDLNGDGKAEVVLEQTLSCVTGAAGTGMLCTIGTQRQVQ